MMGMPLTAYITDISDLETYDFDATPKIEFSGEIFNFKSEPDMCLPNKIKTGNHLNVYFC